MIFDLREEDIEQVLRISDKFVGESFQTNETMRNYILDTQKVLKVYRINDEIIGFVKGEVLEKSEFRNSLLKTNDSIDEQLQGEGNVGIAETICVKEEYRGTGVAKELAVELIHSLKEIENTDLICSTVWKSVDGANAKNLVEKIGFENIAEIPAYWYDDSIEKNYICPKCGKPPCKCSMIFYKL